MEENKNKLVSNTKGNTKKKMVGGITGKGFDVLGQPSPETKSRGWDRKKSKQEIMDMITELRNMSVGELEELKVDIKKNPNKHTVLEVKMVQYLSKEKFTIDFLDRNVGKAPQDIDITSDGTGIKKYILEFKQNAGDEDSIHEDIEGTTASTE